MFHLAGVCLFLRIRPDCIQTVIDGHSLGLCFPPACNLAQLTDTVAAIRILLSESLSDDCLDCCSSAGIHKTDLVIDTSVAFGPAQLTPLPPLSCSCAWASNVVVTRPICGCGHECHVLLLSGAARAGRRVQQVETVCRPPQVLRAGSRALVFRFQFSFYGSSICVLGFLFPCSVSKRQQ